MVDTKPLLKGFGAAADVFGQIATDKAVNSRRQRSSFLQTDITNGQLIEDYTLTAENQGVISHGLNRVPSGAIVIKQNIGNAIYCSGTTQDTLQMSETSGIVTVWVF